MSAAIDLYVGGHAGTIQGERDDLVGKRMFTAAHRPLRAGFALPDLEGWIDSGAYSDSPARRLSPDAALARQLAFETKAQALWGGSWQASGLVSYDLLIDETWTEETRQKRRWSVANAEAAVRVTVDAAHYLSSQRERLTGRRLILSAQGVDPIQYAECAAGVLQACRADDVFGLGGWCILGRHTRLLPTFWATLRLVLPMVALSGVTRLHIFGVMYQPALGGLRWLADQYTTPDGQPLFTISTDSTAPVLACTWKDPKNQKKAGSRRMPYWRDNVRWWQDALRDMRTSPHYKEPPDILALRQMRQECFL